MKFLLNADHHHFFMKNRYIAFDELLSISEAKELKKALDAVIAQKLGMPAAHIKLTSPECIFGSGHDLWRKDPLIKKMVMQKRFAEIASPLFSCTPLRLAYDQYVVSNPAAAPFLHPKSLQQMSCIQKITGGLLLILSETRAGSPISPQEFSVPQTIGSGIFLSPEFQIPWPKIFQLENLSALLIVYTQEKSLYILEPQGIHTQALKKLGYGFGDHLKDHTHPIVLRYTQTT